MSSISIAEREEGPEGIADVIRWEAFRPQYGTAGPRKKIRYTPISSGRVEPQAQTGLKSVRIP
jgi:hypothetical protein